MIIKFKAIADSKENEWVGWFGDDVIKVRLKASSSDAKKTLMDFIHTDLGIAHKDMVTVKVSNPKLIAIQFPEQAWEIFWSIIEK